MEADNRPSFTETFRQHISHDGVEADADISVTVRAGNKDDAATIHRELMKGVKDAAPAKFYEVETGPSTPCDTSGRVSAPPVDSPYHCATVDSIASSRATGAIGAEPFVPEVSIGEYATGEDRDSFVDWQYKLSLNPPAPPYGKTVRPDGVEVYFPLNTPFPG